MLRLNARLHAKCLDDAVHNRLREEERDCGQDAHDDREDGVRGGEAGRRAPDERERSRGHPQCETNPPRARTSDKH